MDWDKDEHKEAIKEAFKEYLDEKAAEFGKWTIKWLATACLVALITYLAVHGFLK